MSRETVYMYLYISYGANKKIIIKKTKIDQMGAHLRRTEAMPTASLACKIAIRLDAT